MTRSLPITFFLLLALCSSLLVSGQDNLGAYLREDRHSSTVSFAVFNAVDIGSDRLDVLWNNTRLIDGVNYGSQSERVCIANGTRGSLSTIRASSPLSDLAGEIVTGYHDVTMVVYGSQAQPQIMMLDDSVNSTINGTSQIRVVNIGLNGPTVDLRIVGSSSNFISRVISRNASDFYVYTLNNTLNFLYGENVTFEILDSNTQKVLATLYDVHLENRNLYSVYVYNTSYNNVNNESTIHSTITNLGASCMYYPVPNEDRSSVRFVHADKNMGALNLYDSQGLLTRNLAYGSSSEYAQQYSTLSVRSAQNNQILYNETLPTRSLKKAYTILLLGNQSAQRISQIEDINLVEAGSARIRVINIASSVISVGRIVNGQTLNLFRGLTYGNVSVYQTIPSGLFNLTVNVSNSDNNNNNNNVVSAKLLSLDSDSSESGDYTNGNYVSTRNAAYNLVDGASYTLLLSDNVSNNNGNNNNNNFNLRFGLGLLFVLGLVIGTIFVLNFFIMMAIV